MRGPRLCALVDLLRDAAAWSLLLQVCAIQRYCEAIPVNADVLRFLSRVGQTEHVELVCELVGNKEENGRTKSQGQKWARFRNWGSDT